MRVCVKRNVVIGMAGLGLGLAMGCVPATGGGGPGVNDNQTANLNDNVALNDNQVGNDNQTANTNDNEPVSNTNDNLPAGTVSFENDLMALWNSAGCLSSSCHGSSTFPQSSFDLRTYDSMFEPGTEATLLGIDPIVPGDPDSSYLFEKISSTSPTIGSQMPQIGDKLTAEEIDLVRTWIEEGAQNN